MQNYAHTKILFLQLFKCSHLFLHFINLAINRLEFYVQLIDLIEIFGIWQTIQQLLYFEFTFIIGKLELLYLFGIKLQNILNIIHNLRTDILYFGSLINLFNHIFETLLFIVLLIFKSMDITLALSNSTLKKQVGLLSPAQHQLIINLTFVFLSLILHIIIQIVLQLAVFLVQN